MAWSGVVVLAASLTLSLGCSPAEDTADREAPPAAVANGDVAPAERAADASGPAAGQSDAAAANEIEVPVDGSAEELLAFLDQLKQRPHRSREELRPTAEAMLKATDALQEKADLTEEQQFQLVKDQLTALGLLAETSPTYEERREELVAKLVDDEREQFAALGRFERIKDDLRGFMSMSTEDRETFVSELESVVDVIGFESTAPLVSTLARGLEQTGDTQLAARLYEKMHGWMEQADDPRLRERADAMMGAARRLRLPGNFLELEGTNAQGEPFDWESYRGKVVLVDFWASWCGPCRAEIPNIKENLEEYGDEGFAVVGVNLDDSMQDYRQYVESEEITWVNLVPEQPENRGWQNPIAVRYGVNAIPTAILVDKEGKVVSLSARGEELDRQLAQLLGDSDQEGQGDNESASEEEGA